MGYLYDEINYYAMSRKRQEQEHNTQHTYTHQTSMHIYTKREISSLNIHAHWIHKHRKWTLWVRSFRLQFQD